MRRGKLGISQYLAFFFVIIFTNAAASELTGWSETFSQGRLDLAHWQPTFEGDCRDCSVSVVNTVEQDTGDYRLRLSMDTRGTQDETVKFLGVRTMRSIGVDDHITWNVTATDGSGNQTTSVRQVLVVNPGKKP